ncbi:MAG: hypothetical protein AAF757_26925, partial [Cyanobacteria bacterium P01_D01_bin.116]
ESIRGTLTLSDVAPPGGLVVQLKSSNSRVATVEQTVTVPGGKNSANFEVTTSDVAKNTPVTITASYQGQARNSTLTVTPQLQLL